MSAGPTVAITGPVNGSSTNSTEPTITATAADVGGPGLASVQFQYSANGGSTWINAGAPESAAPFRYTFPSALPEGTYALRAVATDTAGLSTISSPASYGSATMLTSFYNTASEANLIEDSLGDLFGTTIGGGTYGSGTVFELPAGGSAATTLVSFNSANGASVAGGVIEDSSGNLFGTTQYGGAFGFGTVFEVAARTGAITDLASFNYNNGANPVAGLVEDHAGDLFGTTYDGGTLAMAPSSRLRPAATLSR